MYGIACALRVVIIHECKFSRLHERQTRFLFSTVREYTVDHALFARRSIGEESNATIYMDGEGW